MTSTGWLALNEYSAKYKISLSTLRRRIHADQADYRFEGGKYWLPDKPIHKHTRVSFQLDHLDIQENANPNQPEGHPAHLAAAQSAPTQTPNGLNPSQQNPEAAVFLDSANQIMQELKRAYISVLQEKESQIMQLKEELVDLKTLVKVLEAENERLRG